MGEPPGTAAEALSRYVAEMSLTGVSVPPMDYTSLQIVDVEEGGILLRDDRGAVRYLHRQPW
jgi:hypothetical protein